VKIIVSAPTIIGGICYEPSHVPQDAPDNVAQHMIDIGNARKFETKILEVEETKAVKKSSSASQPAPVSQKKTAKPRRKRKPQS